MASGLEVLLASQYAYLLANTPQLASQTLISATTATVTIPVPAGYNNLEVVWRGRASDAAASESLFLQFNGDTSTHYLWQMVQANNASATGGSGGGATTQMQVGIITANNATASYWSGGRFTVTGASDVTDKVVVGTGGAFATATNSWAGTYTGMWHNSAAVSSMTLACATGSFLAGSRFSLYVSN